MRPPNLVSALASMAESCPSMTHLKQIHAHSITSNLNHHPTLLAKMLRFTAVSPLGNLTYAHQLFDEIPQPNTFLYNTLIRGYAKSTSPSRSVYLFNRMRRNCVLPDEFSLNFLIKAKSRMRVHEIRDVSSVIEGDEIHGLVVKLGFCSHLFVQNALIHLYAVRECPMVARKVFGETVGVDVVSWSGLVLAHVKAGELEDARRVFEAMPEKDVVSWTAMISGYSQARYSVDALALFKKMRDAGTRPDEVTLVSVISACKHLGDVEFGISVHSYIEENGFGWMVSLSNALINMYAKCGCLDRAWMVFSSMHRKSLITWNTMISGFANHGNAEDAFALFRCMLDSGLAPDAITLLALLTAHARKGLVDEGCKLFKTMQRDYGIEADIEHYGCMVDMLGHAGRLEDAYELLNNMPIPSNDFVWRALFDACRTYRNVDMGERVVKKLIELKPDDDAYYSFLHDIYVASGQIAEANQMRQVAKGTGYSWMES